MSSNNQRSWPFSNARSTGEENQGVLDCLLATNALDEISSAADFIAVKEYVEGKGRVDETGKTTVGTIFWVYPTGLDGPYHKEEDGRVRRHGVLFTVEASASVEEVVNRARLSLWDTIFHEHVTGA
jgi:hypothetical protein